ncbi:hypothetical protein ACIG56_33220 [Nocardia fusca]|uniref:hypothetical protein n=1 Tax=Nocardia fusca TaxID=941183 RepID=UPI0037CA46F8
MENAEGLGPPRAVARRVGELVADVALHGDARPVHAEPHADSLALLDERRKNLSTNRICSVNQLHALLEIAPVSRTSLV